MARAAGTESAIETFLSRLEASYDSFPVNQTTVSLPHEQLQRIRNQREPDAVDAYAEVYNDDRQILHVEADGQASLPGDSLDVDAPLEPQVRAAVERATGVDCVVEGIDSATIAGLRNEDEPNAETVYRLVVIFEARHREGSPKPGVFWESDRRQLGSVYA
jgi:ADP-ribose pyrophosphatase YjhB (NUDIX family)